MVAKRGFFQTYRLIPVVIGSLILFALIGAVAILIWSLIAYLAKSDIGTFQTLPTILWLATLFVTVAIMTIFTRGGTVFPALFLAIVTVAVSCFLVKPELLSIGGVLLKLGASLLTGIIAFTITKLIIISTKAVRRHQPLPEYESEEPGLDYEEIDLSEKPEPPTKGTKLF